MPELPEVETIARDLKKVLVGKTIKALSSGDGQAFLSTIKQLQKASVGYKIKDVRRRAKMIIIDLGKNYLLVHLKMTGQLIFRDHKKLIAGGHPIVSTGFTVPNKFTRLVFTFIDQTKLYFNDIRKFGWIKQVSPKDFLEVEKKIGYEPFAKDLTFKKFVDLIDRRSRTSIKAALLDQKLIVGLGNIYVDEILFKAKIKPSRLVKSLKLLEKKKLYQVMPKILQQAILKRGTTFSNFRDASGFEGSFIKYLKVYGRANKPCKNCRQLISKTRLAGRGTHWCPNCQK